MKTRSMADPVRFPTMTTAQIRETFSIDTLYRPGEIHQVYVDLDRAVVGMAAPLENPIALTADDTLRAKSFVERRELGVLNIGWQWRHSRWKRELSAEESRLPVCRTGRRRSFIRVDRSRFSRYFLSSQLPGPLQLSHNADSEKRRQPG